MSERDPLPFDTAQGVGMPSRVIREPFALEQLHTVVAAALRSRDLARSRGETPRGHRIVVTDFMQIGNLVAADAAGRTDSLLPQEAHKLLDLEDHDHLLARWKEIEPIARYVIATHEAAAEAVKLDGVTPVTVSSMQDDPERMFHSSDFRLLLSSIWGHRDTKVDAAGDREAQVIEVLRSLMPTKHKRRFDHARGGVKEGYYTYGLVETAFLAQLAREGVTAIQYGHRREKGYAELAKAVLSQVLRLNADVSSRVVTIPETGMILRGGFEADSYRVGSQEHAKRERLVINPPPSLDDLKMSLLDSTTQRFDPEKWQYVKIHILRLLSRLSEILNIEAHARQRIQGIYRDADSHDKVTPADATFVLELLHDAVVEPLRVILERRGLIWVPGTGNGGQDNGGDPPSDPGPGSPTAGGADTRSAK